MKHVLIEDRRRKDQRWMVNRVMCHERTSTGKADYYVDDQTEEGMCCGASFGEYHYHGCSYKGKFEYRGRLFCGIHHPPRRYDKALARHDKWEARMDAMQAGWVYSDALKAWKDQVMAALIKISEGELNDPAGYAQMVLEDRPKEPTDD